MWHRRSDEDFGAEVDAHLELEVDRLIGDGLTPDAARAAARKAFGNVARAREDFHERSRWTWLEQCRQDLRYAWRGLRAAPSFLITSVLTLSVGLAAVTVAFTVFNAYVLRPFAVRDPGSLYRIAWRAGDDGSRLFRWDDYRALRGRVDLFDAVIADHSRYVNSDGRTIEGSFVSNNYFDALAPRTALGRGLSAVDDRQPVAVLSEQGWTRLFARDPAVVGRALDIDGQSFTVIGVTDSEFNGIDDTPRDVWAPLSTRLERFSAERRIGISARLRPGVGAAQAEAALSVQMPDLVDPRKDGRPVRAELTSQATPNPLSIGMLAVLSPVFAAFGLVLVTACANVSNVVLSRAITRHREIAVRLSLGASRGRIVRQFVTEGLLVSLLAGAVGLMLAAWTLQAGLAAFFRTLPPSFAALVRVTPLGFDHRVFLFGLLIALAMTLIVALAPALQASRAPLTDALRGQRTGTLRSARLRGALVAAQVAVSIVLVVSATTLARNGKAIGAIDPGFDARGVTSINVRGEDEGALAGRLAPILAADPQVASVAVSSGNPFFVTRPAALIPDGSIGSAVVTRYTFASPEYFSILRIPILEGRLFSDAETAVGAPVAVVSAATATQFWPGQPAVGRTITIERPNGRPVDELPGISVVTVVGVVGDIMSGLPVDGRDNGHIYFPTRAGRPQASAILLRPRATRGFDPSAMRDLLRRVSSDTEKFEVLPLDEVRETMTYPLWAASWIGALLGGIAIVLSISGLYGVLSYTLAQRTREIGIRMALGATAGAIIRLVMRQSAHLAGAGTAIGVVVVFAVLKALSSVVRLNEITFIDQSAFALGIAAVAFATAVAAYRPSRRATRIDPAETLRAEA